jgi:photosystem II stability/assembly factor-like uncharacterized protein
MARILESPSNNQFRKRFHHAPKSTRVWPTILIGTSLLVGVVTITSVSNGASYSKPLSNVSSRASLTLSTWTTPGNEMDAPIVPTPGGAVLGTGAFNAISCITSTDCVAVGGDNNLDAVAAFSSDGGTSWSESTVPSGLPQLNALDCSNDSNCVAVGEGDVATSTDGGVTWISHTIPTANTTLLGVSCSTSSTCVSVGVSPGNNGPYSGQLLYSSNAGDTWSVPELPAYVGALGSVDCPSSTFCVAVGASILESNDGGQTWTASFVNGGTGVLRTVSCASTLDCVGIGSNPMGITNSSAQAYEILTTDGGSSWTSVNTPVSSYLLNTISCSGGDDCTVSGPSAHGGAAPLWNSSDGGATWTSQDPPAGVTAVGGLACTGNSGCAFVGWRGTDPVSGDSTTASSTDVSSVLNEVTTEDGAQ